VRALVYGVMGPIALVGVLATAPGCSNPFGGACTLIGCTDGIMVSFETPPPDGTLVELEGPFGVPWRVECGVDLDCGTGIFFADYTPQQLTVRVVTRAGEATESFQPTYEKFQPNGEDCSPTCWRATVVMGLPS
jgi:hypothetical protein